MLEIRKKLGLFEGSLFQHAFIMDWISVGYSLGMGRRSPSNITRWRTSSLVIFYLGINEGEKVSVMLRK
jgi:hypothetical protein